MPGRLLLDLSHTSHTLARTGIQRVVRSIHRELGDSAEPITYDPFQGSWRPLEPWECANLASTETGAKRGAAWPVGAQLRGRWRRWQGIEKWTPPGDRAGFLTAEIFSPAAGASLPNIFPRVAVFHDAIALRFPELTPSGTVSRFPGYLRELLAFDGIAAVSEDSRQALLDYWRWLGVTQPPPVTAIGLGVDPIRLAPPVLPADAPPVVLSVGTIEGRKNHLALLEACERLWAAGQRFTLRLVGSAQPQTGRAALEKIQALQSAGRAVLYDGPLSDEAVNAAYAACAFTVYPSLMEGFGLPVIESLARGRPCICSGRGALGELSRHDGCVALDSVDSDALASAIGRLLDSPAERARLTSAAKNRHFKTWADYTRELADWMKTLAAP